MIKYMFSTKPGQNIISDIWLLLLRISVGASMLTHALPKLDLLFSGKEIMFIDPLGIGMTTSLILVVFAEFFCSIMLITGFTTRIALIPLIFTMFIAAFVFHKSDPFAKKELAIMYLLIYITVFITGLGIYSIDKLIEKLISKRKSS